MTDFLSSPVTETVNIVWPPLKKALWDVLMAEQLNDGHYIKAFDLIEKLYAAALSSCHAQRPSMPFTEEMLLAGARAIFNADIGAPDWHFPYWRDFKADCFRYARLVLEATSDSSTLGNSQKPKVELTEGEKHTLERIASARAAGIELHPFWLDFERAALSDSSPEGKS